MADDLPPGFTLDKPGGDLPAGFTLDTPPPPAERAPTKPYTGGILPFSVDEAGNKKFDPRAGLLGSIVQPIEYVHDVRTGKKPINVGEALETALNVGPGAVASRVGKSLIQSPTREALFESAENRFKAFRESQQIFPGDDYRAFLRATAADLEKKGYYNTSEGAQHAHTTISRELERTKNHPFVSAPDVDALKTQLSAAGLEGQNLSGTMKARDALYGFLEQRGDTNIKKAVGDWRQAEHSSQLAGKDTAQSYKNIAAAQGPELTAKQKRDNIAKTLTDIELERKSARGFSPTEESILQKGLTATPGIDRAQRWGDKLKLAAPGGGMTPAGFTAGGGLLGSVGAFLADKPGAAVTAAAIAGTAGAAGAGLRSYANRGARQFADEADNAIRGLSPLAIEQRATAPVDFTARLPSPFSPSTLAGPAAAAAVRQRRQEQQFPPRYQVLPDGTIQETL